MVERTLQILLCCLMTVLTSLAQEQSNFYPFGEGNRDNYLQKANDVSSPEIRLRFGFPYYNEKYWILYVNDNGVISFNNPYTKFTGPQPNFPIGPDDEDPQNVLDRILIAPFWANVDMTQRGYVYFRQTSEQDLLERATEQVKTGFVEWSNFEAKEMIVATWMEVGFYGDTGGRNLRNSFQCIIVTNQFETFVIFIYDLIEWTTGVESNGRPDTGIGGTPAQVGFNAGDGSKYWSHQYSRDGTFLMNLPIESNIEDPGVWVYFVSSIFIDIGGCTTAGEVRTYPRYDSMLGHSTLYIQGPCFTLEDIIWIQFGPADDPLHVTNCTWMSRQRAWCIVPTFYQVGIIDIQVSNDDARSFPYTGIFNVVDITDLPPTIKRINPQGECWQIAYRPLSIVWDASKINFTLINIEVLTYNEEDGVPSWEVTEQLAYDVPNTGRYEWIGRPTGKITDKNAVGAIRITRRWKRDYTALWTDVHWLGYMLNDKYQNNPATYSNLRCEEWYEEQQNAPEWNFEYDLNPCPCDLSQAMADRARFRPLETCDMENAGKDDILDYCFLREGIKHCVIDIINSPQTADSVCCYDYEENLVYAGDSYSGSFSNRVTVNGVEPYNAVGKVPQMSSWIADRIPWYFCCVWGDLCMYYQEYRATRDCRWYQPPRMAVIFGDPHFVSFDGVEFSFNGKGEWLLFRTTANAQKRFTLQGRTEVMPDWQGNIVKATRMTSIAMKEQDRETIEIQHNPKDILQVVYMGKHFKIERQKRLVLDRFFLTFPRKFEDGNTTQIIITFLESNVGIVVNGTAAGMFIQVIVPYEFKGFVEGLLGNWNDNPDDDLSSNGGTIVNPNSTTEVIYNQFGKTWEISKEDTLFQYEQGQNHDFFQDNDFVPNFDAPPGNLPPELSSQDIVEVCQGNEFCVYDVQSTGLILLGKATKKAYEDYKSAQRALRKIDTCQYIKTPKNGTKNFMRERNHNVGSEIEFRCDENFIPIGPEYRVCQEGGTWSGGVQEDKIVNDCYESMICGSLKTPPHGSIDIVDGRPESIEVVYSCDIGYRRFGRKYRHCRQEFERWKGFRPGCYETINPLALALAIVGGVIGAVLIVLLIVCIFRWATKKDREDAQAKTERELFNDIQIEPSTSGGGAAVDEDPFVYPTKPSKKEPAPAAKPAASEPTYKPAPQDDLLSDPDMLPPLVIDSTLPSDFEQTNMAYASESWA